MTQLDAPTASAPPSAFLPAVGDSIVVGIVDVREYAQRDLSTGEPKTWSDGSAMMGKLVVGMVVSLTGSTAGGGERASTPVNQGDLVSFWCEGGKWFTYQAALKAADGINVGDVMLWKRLDDKPPAQRGHNPQKVYEAKIRRPEAKDGDLLDRCTAARSELLSQRLDASPPPASPAPTPASWDEEPF